MAHHIFRRCLLADVVPPVPPVFPSLDDRISIGTSFGLLVTGVEFNQSVAGLSVMQAMRVVPIPPGVETGDAQDRLSIDARMYLTGLVFDGLSLQGGVYPEAYQ